MKTSNKLLITLAAILLIVPIVVIAVNVKLNYRTHRFEDTYLGAQEINAQAFNQKSEGRVSLPINSSFNSIEIKDAKDFDVQLYINRDAHYGIKVQEELKRDIQFQTDPNGTLQISINHTLKNERNAYRKIIIVVYCPEIRKVHVANASLFDITATSDSLNLDVENTGTLNLSGSIINYDAKGRVTKKFGAFNVGKLKLNLSKTDFSGMSNDYKNLDITAYKSNISIGENVDKDYKFNFDKLSIVTTDTSSVKLRNVHASQFKGSFSDETLLQIPTPMLKQLFKN